MFQSYYFNIIFVNCAIKLHSNPNEHMIKEMVYFYDNSGKCKYCVNLREDKRISL